MRADRKKARGSRRRRSIFLAASVGLILVGLWFGGTNAYAYFKGYFLLKPAEIAAEDPEPVQVNMEEDTADTEQPLYPVRPKIGDNIGDLIIPVLDAKLPIYHGTDEDELEKGVGHFAGSVLPGEQDNSVLSGHRDTIFRTLGDVKKGDLLIVETSAGKFTYKVKNTRIVDKDELSVIVPKPKATLTVSTCYPFYYVGPAPERFILMADLVDSQLTNQEQTEVSAAN
ncbi:class D sortase [Jeotgalibacillus proteolyticus]|uniref:Class D sortase n=1 Tax=Jeotgalibacillus proteolyticus TaxID=2082395 RepID=A0A2S5GBF7_9BACL|nr:class D sortase [Jeotgalibacillus proteolyticus]PPA70377.1 class D sortase [Jeotgalibacillus proteolyticus]